MRRLTPSALALLALAIAPPGGVARLLGFSRIQDRSASDDFSQAAVGIRLGSDR